MIARLLAVACTAVVSLAAFVAPAFAVDPGLIERAKKEGKVVYYSTRQISTMRVLGERFKARYGIELEYSRHSNEDLVRKIIGEYNAKRPTADVFGASTGFAFLLKEGIVDQYKVEEAEGYDAAAKDPDHRWVASNVYIGTLAYNKSLVAPADVPKTIDDVLSPKFANRKIVFAAQYNAGGIIGLLGGLEVMRGNAAAAEFARKLKAQNPISLDASPSSAAEALAAGQAAICIGCLNQEIMRAAEKGAPVVWSTTVQPMVAYYGHSGIVKGQAHPNAARLFVEWMSSQEGQLVNEQEFGLGPRTGVNAQMEALKPNVSKFTTIAITPKMINEDMPRWQKMFEDNLR